MQIKINMRFLEFFESPNKTLSSWRLVGILAGIVSIICTYQASRHLVAVNNTEALLRLIDSLMIFSVTCLGGGLSQHLMNKKNEQVKSDSGSN